MITRYDKNICLFSTNEPNILEELNFFCIKHQKPLLYGSKENETNAIIKFNLENLTFPLFLIQTNNDIIETSIVHNFKLKSKISKSNITFGKIIKNFLLFQQTLLKEWERLKSENDSINSFFETEILYKSQWNLYEIFKCFEQAENKIKSELIDKYSFKLSFSNTYDEIILSRLINIFNQAVYIKPREKHKMIKKELSLHDLIAIMHAFYHSFKTILSYNIYSLLNFYQKENNMKQIVILI
jgi:hypothetical protein